MKVALVVPAFPRLSETFIAAKALGLVERGHDVQIVCDSTREGDWGAYGPGHPVNTLRDRVHCTPIGGWRPREVATTLRRASPLAREPALVASYLRDGRTGVSRRARDLVIDAPLLALRPDVVHFEFGALAVGRMHLRHQLDAAITVSFRGYDLNYVGLDDPNHYQEVWEGADRVHLLGHDLRQRALRRGAPPDLPHSLIPPAIDVDAITPKSARPGPLGTPDAALRVLSIGRLHWKKGYDDALDAVALLRARGIAVEHRIVGDGDLLTGVAFWRHQNGLDDVVALLRSQTPAQVSEHLGWADVLLHAATSEGFGNAVIEAQAHGVPVVCTDADGLPENVEDGVTGIVVPRRDPAALAEALTRVAEDDGLRREMSKAGPRRVAEHFGLDDQLDAWERFYADALRGRAQQLAGRT